MIQKKICMVGSFAVGKTSLVQRFVRSIFSEKYLTTVGVKIDQKTVSVNGTQLKMILWDLHGEDEFQTIRTSYLRGSSGYFLVVDGTRPSTLETAQRLKKLVEETVGTVPFILLVNKADLEEDWEIEEAALKQLQAAGWQVERTSAKTGEGVEKVFLNLAAAILEQEDG